MGITIPETAVRHQSAIDDEGIFQTVRLWIDLLACHKYKEAYQLTAHDPYYEWTSDLMRRVIEGYGFPDESNSPKVAISKIDETHGGETPRWEITRYEDAEDDKLAGDVWIDLPLDGQWSDLTATFQLHVQDGQLVLVLNDIHVF